MDDEKYIPIEYLEKIKQSFCDHQSAVTNILEASKQMHEIVMGLHENVHILEMEAKGILKRPIEYTIDHCEYH